METLVANVTKIVDVVTALMGLFDVFPLNIILAGSIAGLGFKLIKKGKRAAA